MRNRIALTLLSFILILDRTPADAQDILSKIDQIAGVTVEETPRVIGFKRSFKIMLEQPLDHGNPNSPTFRQQILLSHVDVTAPVIMVTEGYSLTLQKASELTDYFYANQINVEHRFFNVSKPDSLQWRYLTTKQAAADDHRIVELFKKIYPGKWLSTGISKGGQTALFHRAFYPDDVDATVAYVAPIPLSDADPRLDEWIKTLGGAECWQKMQTFQKAVLMKRQEVLPRIATWSAGQDYTYSFPIREVLNYAILEYPFAFWQTGNSSCDDIPGANASTDSLFRHLILNVPFNWFSVKDIEANTAAYYQFFTELGFYHFMTDHLQEFFVDSPAPSYRAFGPRNIEMKFNPEPMQKIHAWLQNEANNIIYIYGATDAWTGAAVTPSANTNSLKFVVRGHAHASRIRHLPADERKRLLIALAVWLGIDM